MLVTGWSGPEARSGGRGRSGSPAYDLVEGGRPGTWFGASRLLGLAGGHGVDWLQGLDVRQWQPDRVRVPGAYLRHAPGGWGDMKLSGDDRASSLT